MVMVIFVNMVCVLFMWISGSMMNGMVIVKVVRMISMWCVLKWLVSVVVLSCMKNCSMVI